MLDSQLLHSYAMITVVLIEMIVLLSVVLLVSESQRCRWAQLVRDCRGKFCPDKYLESAALRARNHRGKSGTEKYRVNQVWLLLVPVWYPSSFSVEEDSLVV